MTKHEKAFQEVYREAREKLGAMVRNERIKAGWSLRDLAEKSRVGKSTIHNIERGKSNPTIRTIGRIFMEFGIRS